VAVLRVFREARVDRVAQCLKKSTRFNKNIKNQAGLLIIEDEELGLVLM
jgi:hypothetical protein